MPVNKALLYPLEIASPAWRGCYRLALKHLSTKHLVQFFLNHCISLHTCHCIVYVCLYHLSEAQSQGMLVWWVQMSGWAGLYPSGFCVWQTAWLQWLEWWNELWWARLLDEPSSFALEMSGIALLILNRLISILIEI